MTGLRLPAWLKTDKAVVALIGVLAASILPITTLIQARTQLAVEVARGETELKLQAEKQKHDIRMAYFEKAISSEDPEESRMQVLRFLAYSFDDEDLQRWAREELAASSGGMDEEACRTRRIRCSTSCLAASHRKTDWTADRDTVEETSRRQFDECLSTCWKPGPDCGPVYATIRAKNKARQEAEEAALMSFGTDYEPPPDLGSTPVSSAPRSAPP